MLRLAGWRVAGPWSGADLQPRLLQHQHEVVGLGRGPQGVVHGDQPLPHHAQQGLIERLHPVVVAVGDDLVDLGGPVGVQDPVGDAAVVDHDLDGGDPAAAGPGNQPHADDSTEHAGQRDPDLVLLVGREEVDDAVHRLHRVGGVEGRQHEVTGLAGSESGPYRLGVTHLTDQDDVGVLADDRAHRGRVAVGVHADLSLVHGGHAVGVEDLDGLLDRHDVNGTVVVDLVDHAGEGG